MSYPRRIKAFCWECDPSREDCEAPACPFYSLRKYNSKDEVSWWKLPKDQWKEGQRIARIENRLIEPREKRLPNKSSIEALQKWREQSAKG